MVPSEKIRLIGLIVAGSGGIEMRAEYPLSAPYCHSSFCTAGTRQKS